MYIHPSLWRKHIGVLLFPLNPFNYWGLFYSKTERKYVSFVGDSHPKPGPREAAKTEGEGEKDCGSSSPHDQRSQQHEHCLSKIYLSIQVLATVAKEVQTSYSYNIHVQIKIDYQCECYLFMNNRNITWITTTFFCMSWIVIEITKSAFILGKE